MGSFPLQITNMTIANYRKIFLNLINFQKFLQTKQFKMKLQLLGNNLKENDSKEAFPYNM